MFWYKLIKDKGIIEDRAGGFFIRNDYQLCHALELAEPRLYRELKDKHEKKEKKKKKKSIKETTA